MRFQRTNYLVSDGNRALLFYRDILGMTLDFMKQSEDDSYSYEVFDINKSMPIDFAILSYKDQPRIMALTILGEGNLDTKVPEVKADKENTSKENHEYTTNPSLQDIRKLKSQILPYLNNLFYPFCSKKILVFDYFI